MAAAASGAATSAGRPSDRVNLAREMGLTALVALGLTLPLVGFETVDQEGGLGVRTRFPEMLVSIALIMLGRLGFTLIGAGFVRPTVAVAGTVGVVTAAVLILSPGAVPNAPLGWLAVIGAVAVVVKGVRQLTAGPEESAIERVGGTIASAVRRALPAIAVAALVFALFLPVMPFAERRLLDLSILVLTYVMLGWGLNIVVGLAGLLDLGYVAFYAVGAYSYALLALTFDLSFWVCLPLAGAFAAAFGILLGFPVLRLRGDYLAIVTLGFGEIIRIILLNWYEVTRGPDGLSGIPRPSFFGLEFDRRPLEGVESFHTFFGLDYSSLHRIVFLYYLILALALLTNWFTLRIRRLPVGRAWEALREDEIACRSLGINPTNTKLTAFAIGAMFAGFAGSFFATRQGFISPESFTFIESAVILAIVVLGGMGSQMGVVLAAIILIGLPEWFRELEQYRMLAFGAGMVFIMAWRPRGLMSHRDPTIRLGRGPAGGAVASEGGG